MSISLASVYSLFCSYQTNTFYERIKDSCLAASSCIEEEDPEIVQRATALLHETGTAQEVDLRTWRLRVKGDGVGKPLRLTYHSLMEMKMVEYNVVLVCPGA
jgi:hypothetical protein